MSNQMPDNRERTRAPHYEELNAEVLGGGAGEGGRTDMITTYKAYIGSPETVEAAQEYFHAWQTYRKVREDQQELHEAEQEAQRKLIAAGNAVKAAHVGVAGAIVYLVAPGTALLVDHKRADRPGALEIVRVVHA